MSELTKFPQRINFADAKARPEYPDFLEVQLKSFKDFFFVTSISLISELN